MIVLNPLGIRKPLPKSDLEEEDSYLVDKFKSIVGKVSETLAKSREYTFVRPVNLVAALTSKLQETAPGTRDLPEEHPLKIRPETTRGILESLEKPPEVRILEDIKPTTRTGGATKGVVQGLAGFLDPGLLGAMAVSPAAIHKPAAGLFAALAGIHGSEALEEGVKKAEREGLTPETSEKLAEAGVSLGGGALIGKQLFSKPSVKVPQKPYRVLMPKGEKGPKTIIVGKHPDQVTASRKIERGIKEKLTPEDQQLLDDINLTEKEYFKTGDPEAKTLREELYQEAKERGIELKEKERGPSEVTVGMNRPGWSRSGKGKGFEEQKFPSDTFKLPWRKTSQRLNEVTDDDLTTLKEITIDKTSVAPDNAKLKTDLEAIEAEITRRGKQLAPIGEEGITTIPPEPPEGGGPIVRLPMEGLPEEVLELKDVHPVLRAILSRRNVLTRSNPKLGRDISLKRELGEISSSYALGGLKEIRNILKTSQQQDAFFKMIGPNPPKMYKNLLVDPVVQKAVDAWKRIAETVHRDASNAGIDVGIRLNPLGNYFPEMRKPGYVDPEGYPLKVNIPTGVKDPHLEMTRTTGIPEGELRKDIGVLEKYVSDAYQRIAEVQTFGRQPGKYFGRFRAEKPAIDRWIEEYINHELGYARGKPVISKGLGKARSVMSLVQLPLASILQPLQLIPAAAEGGLVNAAKALSTTVKDFHKIINPERFGLSKADLAATYSGATIPNISHETLHGVGSDPNITKFNWGINALDRWARVTTNKIAEPLTDQILRGEKSAVREAGRLEIVPDQLRRMPIQQARLLVGKRLADRTNLRTGDLDLPHWMSSDYGRTVMQYYRFPIRMNAWLYDTFKSPVKNFDVIWRLAVIGAAGGELGADLREFIRQAIYVTTGSGDKRRKPDIKDIHIDKILSDPKQIVRLKEDVRSVLRTKRIGFDHPFARLMQNYATFASFGLAADLYERLDRVVNKGDVGEVAGPVGSAAHNVIRGAWQTGKRVVKKEKAPFRPLVKETVSNLAPFGHIYAEKVSGVDKKFKSGTGLLGPRPPRVILPKEKQ